MHETTCKERRTRDDVLTSENIPERSPIIAIPNAQRPAPKSGPRSIDATRVLQPERLLEGRDATARDRDLLVHGVEREQQRAARHRFDLLHH